MPRIFLQENKAVLLNSPAVKINHIYERYPTGS